MPCKDCAALRAEMLSQRDFMNQWFQMLITKLDTVEQQSAQLIAKFDAQEQQHHCAAQLNSAQLNNACETFTNSVQRSPNLIFQPITTAECTPNEENNGIMPNFLDGMPNLAKKGSRVEEIVARHRRLRLGVSNTVVHQKPSTSPQNNTPNTTSNDEEQPLPVVIDTSQNLVSPKLEHQDLSTNLVERDNGVSGDIFGGVSGAIGVEPEAEEDDVDTLVNGEENSALSIEGGGETSPPPEDTRLTPSGGIDHLVKRVKLAGSGHIVWKCRICQQCKSSRTNVKRHIIMLHQQVQATLPCRECGKKFKWRHSLVRHEQTVCRNPRSSEIPISMVKL